MSVAEWLYKLNLQKHNFTFQKEKITDVRDLRFVEDEGKLETLLQVKNFNERKRILAMIKNEALAK